MNAVTFVSFDLRHSAYRSSLEMATATEKRMFNKKQRMPLKKALSLMEIHSETLELSSYFLRTKTRCYRLSAERTARPRARSRGPARPARWHSASRASKQSVNSKTFGRKRNPGTLSNTSQILTVRLPIATIQPPVVLATMTKIRWPWRLSQQRASVKHYAGPYSSRTQPRGTRR